MSGMEEKSPQGGGSGRRNKNGKNYAAGIDLSVKLCYTVRALGKQNIAEWSSSVARRAHNPKVVGSNPSSATIKPPILGGFSYFYELFWRVYNMTNYFDANFDANADSKRHYIVFDACSNFC